MPPRPLKSPTSAPTPSNQASPERRRAAGECPNLPASERGCPSRSARPVQPALDKFHAVRSDEAAAGEDARAPDKLDTARCGFWDGADMSRLYLAATVRHAPSCSGIMPFTNKD